LTAQITILPLCLDDQKSGWDRKKLATYCQEAISKTL
jgi:hypothetical protein